MAKRFVKFKTIIPWSLLFNITILALTIVLVLYFIFSEGGFLELLNSGYRLSIIWLLIAIFVHVLNIALDMTVIYLFTKESCPEMTIYKAFICSMTGQFYCAVTPSATGGQPMQILAMSRMGIKPSITTATLIQKFLVWQFTLTTACIIAVVARFGMFSEKMGAPMLVATILGFSMQVFMIIVLLLASFCKPLTKKIVRFLLKTGAKIHIVKNVDEKITGIEETLDSFHENNKKLNKNKKLLVKVYSITAVQMVAYFLVPYCIAKAFYIDCNAFDMLCSQAYVSMVSSLVPLPGGSGAAESSFLVFFQDIFDADKMKSAILLWRTITYYGTIAFTAPFARLQTKKTMELEKLEEEEEAREKAESENEASVEAVSH